MFEMISSPHRRMSSTIRKRQRRRRKKEGTWRHFLQTWWWKRRKHQYRHHHEDNNEELNRTSDSLQESESLRRLLIQTETSSFVNSLVSTTSTSDSNRNIVVHHIPPMPSPYTSRAIRKVKPALATVPEDAPEYRVPLGMSESFERDDNSFQDSIESLDSLVESYWDPEDETSQSCTQEDNFIRQIGSDFFVEHLGFLAIQTQPRQVNLVYDV